MQIIYDEDVDVLRILFGENLTIEESEETTPGVIIDYDIQGQIVGLEFLNASHRMESLNSVEYRFERPTLKKAA